MESGFPPLTNPVSVSFQADAVANMMTTAGYFSVLLSLASQPLFPRARFLKTLLYCILASGLSLALCVLALFCAVKARENSGGSVQGQYFSYNSSACAVSGVFLFFMIWYVFLGSALFRYSLRLKIGILEVGLATRFVRGSQPSIKTQGYAFLC